MKKYLPMCMKAELVLQETTKLLNEVSAEYTTIKSNRALRKIKRRLEVLLKEVENELG